MTSQDPSLQAKKSIGSRFLKYMFSHVGLFFVVAAYAVGGAYAFIALELPNEQAQDLNDRLEGDKVNLSMTYLVNQTYLLHKDLLLMPINSSNNSYPFWASKVQSQLELLRDQIVTAATQNSYTGRSSDFSTSWTFTSTLLFTITLMSTIGYGHIYPVTLYGRLFCIIYSMVGIPLLLVFLANIGDSMASTFTYSYSRLCCRWCRAKRRLTEMSGGKAGLPKLSEEEIGEEAYMPTKDVSVPIMLNLVLIFFYIMLGGAIFTWTEGWTMTTAVYFTYITLSTIGLGDLVPGRKSFMEDKASISAAMQMLGTVIYVLLGMALVSMCLNLMQEQLIEKCRGMAKSLGLSKSEDEVPIKKSTKQVRETENEPEKPKRTRPKPVIPPPPPKETPKPRTPPQYNPFKPSHELSQSPPPSARLGNPHPKSAYIPGTPDPM